ncbi:glycosyltransferase [Natrinema sp. LN54]|uniref:glycosyltransferase n=1 Tax=Natrinema sp. LN54 TaxID=3458705 RepID=UPI0040370A0C
MEQPRVLLISYNYPPGGGIGSVRVAKFAKYLSDEWDVHVVTAPTNTGPQADAEVDSGENATVHYASEIWPTAPKEFEKSRWVPPLCWEITRLHRKYEFDAIWQTAGPFLPLTTALFVKPLLQIPYVIDLRDAWTLHPYKPDRTVFGRIHDGVSAVAEPAVFRVATAITTATDGITNEYKSRYPSLSAKFRTIENGYDPSDFPVHDVEKPDEFTIVYVGKFDHFRDTTPFLRSVAELSTETDVTFVHVGREEAQVSSAVSQLGLSDRFQCTGFVSRSEVARQIQRADLGLAVSGGSRQEMTTKIFDYIACETPILACGPKDGSMANVVEQFEHGYIAENRTDEITPILTDVLTSSPESLGSGPYSEYTRERMSEKLMDLLSEFI